MIKANELRIGNKIYSPKSEGNDECHILSIDFDERAEISCDGNNEGESNYIMWVELNSINPIPLTEEWLVKLGFDNASDLHKRKALRNHLSFGEAFEDGTVEYTTMNGFKIKYVHSFQNLYFALTGTEL